jgi:hypothetical protein
MMELRRILAVLCEVFSVTPIMTGGYIEDVPVRGFHARQVSLLWSFTGGET